MDLRRLSVARVSCSALRCSGLERTMDYLHAFLGLYPWRIEQANGIRRAAYPLAGETYLELVEAPGRGPWHGLTLALDPDRSPELRESETSLDGLTHPREPVPAAKLGVGDTCGVALDFTWGGPHGPARARSGFVGANTRIVDRVLGVSIVSSEPEFPAVAYARLGLSFAPLEPDAGDFVLQASCESGSFLQIRAPFDADAPSAELLQRRGPGLFHLALGVQDLEAVTEAVDRVGARIARSVPGSLWTDPESTLGVAIEFRQI